MELPGGDTEVTDADYQYVSALGKVLLSDETSRIVFNLSEDHSSSPLGCSITGAGTIVKDGDGVLQFGTPHNTVLVGNEGWYDYFTTNGIAINGGTLRFPQGSGDRSRFGHVVMAENTTLYTADGAESVVESLNGCGLVTNTATQARTLRIGNSPNTDAKSTFRGTIAGKFMALRTDGLVELLNEANTFAGGIQIVRNADNKPKTDRGITGVAKLGKSGEASSAGVSDTIQIRMGGMLRYLGAGEDCDKSLYVFANAATPAAFDAGTDGSIRWSGKLDVTGSADGRVVFTGDNAGDCVWSGPAAQRNSAWTWYMAKEGSGTWRLAGNANRMNDGAWAVREGTLKFDSLAEKGEVCALGLSTNLCTDAYRTSAASRQTVDYAVLLGSDADYPTLEYSGPGTGVSTNRPLRLTGTGGILANNSATGTVSLNGIAAEDEGAKKLTLGGTNTTGNVAGNISDGAGTVSVEKTGSGVWRLEGNQTFSGSLDVKEGTLIVAETPTQYGYDYYKFTVEQTYEPDRDQYLWIRRIALYDEDGVRIGVNPTEDAPIEDEKDDKNFLTKWHFDGDLQPGHARWDMPSKFIYYSNNSPAAALSENDTALRTAMSGYIRSSTEKYWPSLVWRVPAGSKTATHVDIVQHRDTGESGRVGIFTLYGSGDGISWSRLKRVDLTENTIEKGKWVSDGCAVTNNAVRPGAGFALDKVGQSALPRDVAYNILQSVSGVSVSSGAVLKAEGDVTLSSITIDCSVGNGTIDGFDFAQSGTVNLVNLATEGTTSVPLTLANLPEGALDRLNAKGAWRVTVNGTPKGSLRVSFTGTAVGIYPLGFIISIR